MRRRNREYNSIQLYSYSYINSNLVSNANNSIDLSIESIISTIKNKQNGIYLFNSGRNSKSYEFTDNERISLVKFIDKEYRGIKFNHIRIYLFITILLFRTLTEKSKGKHFFKSLCQSYLTKFIRAQYLNKVIKVLLAAEVIEMLPYSVDNRRCKSFRFNPTHIIKKAAKIDLNTNLLSKEYLKFWIKDSITNEGLDVSLFNSYLDNYRKIEFFDGALAEIEKYKYDSDNARLYNTISAGHINDFANKTLTDKDFDNLRVKYDLATNRFYTNLSNFKKEFRKYIKYKDKDVVTVDCNSCHPFLLLGLYKYAPTDIDYKTERDSYYELFDNGKDFYFEIGLLAGIDIAESKKKESYRKKVKNNYFYKFIYDRPKEEVKCKLTKAFNSNFPILADIIYRLKTDVILPEDDPSYYAICKRPHTQLSFINFRQEGDIMIKSICKTLIEKYPTIWFTTIHDCVVCTKEDAKLVETIMSKAFYDAIGYYARFN